MLYDDGFKRRPWWAQDEAGDSGRRGYVRPEPLPAVEPSWAAVPLKTKTARGWPEPVEYEAPSRPVPARPADRWIPSSSVEIPVDASDDAQTATDAPIDPSSRGAAGKDGGTGAASLDVERQRLAAATADLEGVRRRVEREAERAKQAARASLLDELLPVLDNLDRSLAAADGSSEGGLLAGVRMVRDDLEQVLLRYGAERIESVGRPFDPHEHEAVGMQPVQAPADDGRVVHESRAGYRFGDRVLRAAQVLVGKLAATARRLR